MHRFNSKFILSPVNPIFILRIIPPLIGSLLLPKIAHLFLPLILFIPRDRKMIHLHTSTIRTTLHQRTSMLTFQQAATIGSQRQFWTLSQRIVQLQCSSHFFFFQQQNLRFFAVQNIFISVFFKQRFHLLSVAEDCCLCILNTFISFGIPDTPNHLHWEDMAVEEKSFELFKQLRVILQILYIWTKYSRIFINNTFKPKMISIRKKKLCDLKDFRKQYEEEVITEWLQAYISYESVSRYLDFIKKIYEDYHFKVRKNLEVKVRVHPVWDEVKHQIDKTLEYIDMRVDEGWEKTIKFTSWKYAEILHNWGELMNITLDLHTNNEHTHKTFDKKVYIKRFIKIIYAQTVCLKSFISLNIKIKNHCTEVRYDYADPLLEKYYSIQQENENGVYVPDEDHCINNEHHEEKDFCSHHHKVGYESEEMSTILKDLQDIRKGAKNLFYSPIYFCQHSHSNLNKYNPLAMNNKTSNTSYFFLGLYLGLAIFLFIALGLVLILNFLEFDLDDGHINSMTYIFPMFRGIGLLILYLWGTAWNVYSFLKYKVNFRAILEYGAHYSDPYDIMKRAGFFTLIFCIMLFAYLIGLQYNRGQAEHHHVPIEYSPFLVWCFYIGYIFFPSKQVLNPKGRRYFYGLLKQILLSPVVRISFILTFATDHAVSFVTPIKDFAYTVCFYGSDFTVSDVKNCLNVSTVDGVIITYVVAIVPLILRMIQCFRLARQLTGKFIGHIQMWNFFKYMASMATSTISFLSSYFPELFVPFVISSLFSTSYSYYWDLKNDWGLLEKGSKHPFLRNHLCYKKPIYYYVSMVLNLVLRCSWTLTISPSVVQLIPKSTVLPFVTGILEILRRCIANLFRVEKEHIQNMRTFTVIKDKAEDILKKIRKEEENEQFPIDNQGTETEYTKITDSMFMLQLKSISGYHLPQVKQEEVQMAKAEFMEANQDNGWEKSILAKKEIHRALFLRMRKNYFAL